MDMNMKLDKDILKTIIDQVAAEKLSAADMEGVLHQMHKQMLEAALKVVYLAIMRASKKWTMPIREWRAALNQFSIVFGERMNRHF